MLFFLESHLAVIIGVLLAVAAIAHMLQQRRAPSSSSALSWLLAMILIPYVGIPLYIMLGGRKMARIARRKMTVQLNENHILPLSQASSVDRALRSHNVPAAMLGNRIRFCRSGSEAYDCLVQLIEQAKESLYISTYVFANDGAGRDIVDRLTRKAGQGVRVRLLLDGVGSLKTGSAFFQPLARAGGKFAYFMPVFYHPLRGRSNLRNHRKIALADERLLMAGGTNIAEEYLNPAPLSQKWQDLSFAIEGPAVRPFVELFLSDWAFAGNEHLPIKDFAYTLPDEAERQGILQVVPSGPDCRHDGLYEAILSAVFAAERRLWIVTPYFVPDDALTQGLAIAARRGVDVRIVIPEKSNHFLADLVRGIYLRSIQEAGASIMLYTDGMVHAKVMVMDDKLAMIGSANMDLRSLFLNYEVAVIAYSADEIKAIASYIDNLTEKTVRGYPPAGMLRRLHEGIAQIVAPLV
jgi:cardiolipin synthase